MTEFVSTTTSVSRPRSSSRSFLLCPPLLHQTATDLCCELVAVVCGRFGLGRLGWGGGGVLGEDGESEATRGERRSNT
ncbi:hypothetical protein A2U01_0016323 [Trifolium medium]|uniref:Uncharacterized protein n=1 Tax=Trifolium medium TaxID=97028 RepID=A0A392N8L6_9FABA|nr:hypothetical protein [Trifolium medium]